MYYIALAWSCGIEADAITHILDELNLGDVRCLIAYIQYQRLFNQIHYGCQHEGIQHDCWEGFKKIEIEILRPLYDKGLK
jgi:hypothetical protein